MKTLAQISAILNVILLMALFSSVIKNDYKRQLTLYGESLSQRFGHPFRQLGAFAFLISGWCLILLPLIILFLSDDDFMAHHDFVKKIIAVSWVGNVGALIFLVDWTLWKIR